MKYLIFLLLTPFISAQNKLTVEYENKLILSEKSVDFGNNIVSETQKNQIFEALKTQKIEPTPYILYYNNGNSYFKKNVTTDKNEAFSPTDEGYYKFKNKKGYYEFNDYIVEKFYAFYNDIKKIEYQTETQKIENYICKSALVTENNEISKIWYTEEIPISTGPFNYTSLPGLVLKVETPRRTIYATKITKNCKPEEVKEMDKKLSIYEGKELELKKEEANKKKIEYRKTEVSKQGNLFKNRF
jgi:GLPGLI family protein